MTTDGTHHLRSLAGLRRLCTDVPMMDEGALAAMFHAARSMAAVPPLIPASGPNVRSALADLDAQAAEHPAIRRMRDSLKPQIEMAGNVAVIPIRGALMRNPDPWEMAFGEAEDTDAIRALVEQASADPDVSGILLDVDSPGGFYTGGPELADSIKSAKAKKPVVAFTAGMMASLAYWAGSQANLIVASRSAAVGSIGVYIALLDYSKLYESFGVKLELFTNREGDLKAMGIPGASLTEPQRSHLQSRAQALFGEFRRSVRANRPDITDDAMRGQTLSGSEAKSAGLVDRIGDRSFALSAVRQLIRGVATP